METCNGFESDVCLQKEEDSLYGKKGEWNCDFLGIGAFLKHERAEAHLTQEQIANRINTTKNFISRLENHANDVKLSTLCKYAEALGKHLDIKML